MSWRLVLFLCVVWFVCGFVWATLLWEAWL